MKKITFVTTLAMLLSFSSNGQSKAADEFFVFEPDIRLFTSYAFMNAAGYNHDWNTTMHPLRVEVRNYLDSILTDDYKNEIRQYYEKFGCGDFYGLMRLFAKPIIKYGKEKQRLQTLRNNCLRKQSL